MSHSTSQSHSPGSPRRFVGWMVTERVVRGLVNMVVLAAVARHLEPAGFGALNFALAVVTLIMPLAQLSLDTIAIRMLVQEPDRAGSILGTCCLMRLTMGATSAGLVLAWSLQHESGTHLGVQGPFTLLLILQAFEANDLWFQRWVSATPTAMARLASTAASAVIKLSLVYHGSGVAAFAWAQVVEATVFSGGLWLAYRYGAIVGPRWCWDSQIARSFARQGWGITLGACISGAAFRFDQLAVSHFLGDAAAGSYFAAVRLLEIPFFAASALAISLQPMLVKSKENPEQHRQQLQLSFDALTLFGIISALSFTALSTVLVQIVFGPAFEASARLATIYSWGQIAVFTGLIRLQWISIHPAPGTQVMLAAATLIIQVGLISWMVPIWGLTGAAVASALTFTFAGCILPYAFAATRPLVGPQARSWLILFRPKRLAQLRLLFSKPSSP
ncbi:MAG: hypothetical protein SynsKO_22750 [Synoicihabitans sp.]